MEIKLGEKLRKVRKERGMSIAEMCIRDRYNTVLLWFQ